MNIPPFQFWNWDAIGSIGTAIGSIGTLIAVIIAVVALKSEKNRSTITLSADLAMRLDERFYNSERMLVERRKAAKSILKNPNSNMDGLLDFFELVAVLVNKGALDKEIAWNTFYNPIINYWYGGEPYISSEIKKDSKVWQDLRKLIDIFKKIENKNKSISKKEIEDYMLEEVKI